MIPYAILMCRLTQTDGTELEVRVLELSPQGFTFRISRRISPADILEINRITLWFFKQKSADYYELSLKDYCVEQIPDKEQQGNPFWNLFRITTKDDCFRQAAIALSREYLAYVSGKLYCEDWELSHKLSGWPFSPDSPVCETLEQQYHHWFDSLQADDNWLQQAEIIPERALVLDRKNLWNAFLNTDPASFMAEYWKEHALHHHPISKLQLTHVYIGNAYCHLQMPDQTTLEQIIFKCSANGFTPVIVFSAIPQFARKRAHNLLQHLDAYGTATGTIIEVVVNDWGMIEYLRSHQFDHLTVTLGTLLLRQKKDARITYTFGSEKLKQALSGQGFEETEFLKSVELPDSISGFSGESVGYASTTKHDGLRFNLQLPFYQTNTAAYCPLSNQMEHGSDVLQTENRSCKKYCEFNAFLYPKGSNMVGSYTSLFGLDTRVLTDSMYLRSLLQNNCSRLVFYFI